MSLRKTKKDFLKPLYPKKTKRGGVCYDREWHPAPGQIHVVKAKNPFENQPSSAIIGQEISYDELERRDPRRKKSRCKK